jgi:cytoskeletal protein CcmA (bactofilin family)
MVGEDIRFVARNFTFSGSSKGDIAGAALAVDILPQATVGGDLLVAGGTVMLSGTVQGSARIVAGRVVINGLIKGDLTVSADSVTLGPGASVAGAFRYSASAPAVIEGSVEGPTTFNRIETRSGAERFVPTFLGMWLLVRFATLLLFALAAHGLLKAVSRRFVSEAFTEPGWSIARGFALFIAVPAAALVGALTFIGIPFSFFIFLLYGLALIIGAVYAPIILGSAAFALYRRERIPLVSWKTILVGVLISMCLSFIPYVGSALRAAAFLAALGAIFQVTYRVYIHARERDE